MRQTQTQTTTDLRFATSILRSRGRRGVSVADPKILQCHTDGNKSHDILAGSLFSSRMTGFRTFQQFPKVWKIRNISIDQNTVDFNADEDVLNQPHTYHLGKRKSRVPLSDS